MCFVVVVLVVVVVVVGVVLVVFNNRASLNRLFDAGISVTSFIIYNFGGASACNQQANGGFVLRQSACRGVSHIL